MGGIQHGDGLGSGVDSVSGLLDRNEGTVDIPFVDAVEVSDDRVVVLVDDLPGVGLVVPAFFASAQFTGSLARCS
jgi:hypothetical protein